jgi:hypothetical protein
MALGIGLGLQSAVRSFDPAATAYFARAGVTNPTAKAKINAFIVGLKTAGLYSLLTGCWIGRSAYNAGSGTTVYDLVSNSLNGTFVGSPAWSANGLVFDNTSEAVTTGRTQTMNVSFSAFSVMRMPTASAINRRILGSSGLAGPTLLFASASTPASTPIATYDGVGVGSSGASIDITAFTMIGDTYSGATSQRFFQAGVSIGTAAVTNAAASHTVQLSSSSGEGASDMTMALAMIFGATELTQPQALSLYNIVKGTICSDLSLP